MPLTALSKENAADAIVATGTFISLHTTDPGVTGAGEATGGTPAYARQATVWSADTTDDGVRAGTQVTIDLPAGTYAFFGLWSLGAAGVFIGGGSITSTTLAAQGQIKVTPTYTQS